METQDPLTRGLRAVAEDDERLGASGAIGMRLLAEVHSIAEARRRRVTAVAVAAAAAVFMAVLVPVWRLTSRPPAVAPAAIEGAVVSRELVTEFFPLKYSNVPTGGGYVVRMQVPRATLERFGAASFDAGGANSSTFLADVVIGDDGLARAVRFVRLVNDGQQELTP